MATVQLHVSNYYEFLEVTAHLKYWKHHIHSRAIPVRAHGPSCCLSQTIERNPKYVPVSSCDFFQFTFQATKQKEPQTLPVLTHTLLPKLSSRNEENLKKSKQRATVPGR